jgi:hypothetical protein
MTAQVYAGPRRGDDSPPAAADGLPPAEFRPPAVRLRRPLVAEVLDAHRLEACQCDSIDLGAGQRPWRPVVGIVAVIAGAGDDQQRPAVCHQVADIRDCLTPGRIRQGLERHALHYKIECITPAGRRIQQVGSDVVHSRRGKPPPSRPDGAGRHVECHRVESARRHELRILSETAANNQRTPPGAVESDRAGPADQQLVWHAAIPWDDRGACLGRRIERLEPAHGFPGGQCLAGKSPGMLLWVDGRRWRLRGFIGGHPASMEHSCARRQRVRRSEPGRRDPRRTGAADRSASRCVRT